MFYKTNAQVGDILLYRASDKDLIGNLIKFFSNGGNYCHASIYIGDANIIESGPENGVCQRILNFEFSDKIDIYRLDRTLTSDEKIRLVRYLQAIEVGKGYDFAAYPSAFFKSTLAHIFGWKNFSKFRPLLNDNKNRFCSELVGAAYNNALEIDLRDDIDCQSLTPSDIAKSKALKLIS